MLCIQHLTEKVCLHCFVAGAVRTVMRYTNKLGEHNALLLIDVYLSAGDRQTARAYLLSRPHLVAMRSSLETGTWSAGAGRFAASFAAGRWRSPDDYAPLLTFKYANGTYVSFLDFGIHSPGVVLHPSRPATRSCRS